MEQSQEQGAPRLLVLEIVERIERKVDDIAAAMEECLGLLRQIQQASGGAPPSGGLGH